MASTSDVEQSQVCVIAGQLCQNMKPTASDKDIKDQVRLAIRIQTIVEGMCNGSISYE